jgi:hypothetical protein
MDEFLNRRWLVIPTSITGSIDFSQVLDTNVSTLRYSIDGTETFVKYETNTVTASYTVDYINAETNETGSYTIEAGVYGRPSSIYSTEYTEYNHEEILTLLSTEAWTKPMIIE